jgi:hypothetical protein
LAEIPASKADPVPMNPAQLSRLKNMTTVFRKLLKGVQGYGQLLIRCRH